MKTAEQIRTQAREESMKALGEVSQDFVIGYLSATIAMMENMSPYKKGFSDGYNAGFECARIAAISTVKANDHYNEIEASDKPDNSPKGLAATKSGAGLSPLQSLICVRP